MNQFLTSYRVWITVGSGLETLLLKELAIKNVDAKVLRCVPGESGVELRVNRENLWNIVCKSRLAESVRVRIGSFHASYFGKLKTELTKMPWNAFLSDKQWIETSVTCHESHLYHSGAVEERLKQVPIINLLSNNTKGTPTKVFLRMFRDQGEVSIDCSGPWPMYKRGYREYISETPMRETLAYLAWFWGQTMTNSAYISKLQGKEPPSTPNSSPLAIYDMCCGSGTLLMESLSDVLHDYPYLQRKRYQTNYQYNFELWPTHDKQAFQAYKQTLYNDYQQTLKALQPFPYTYHASDVSKKAITATTQNFNLIHSSTQCINLSNYFTMSIHTLEQAKEQLIKQLKTTADSKRIVLLCNISFAFSPFQ